MEENRTKSSGRPGEPASDLPAGDAVARPSRERGSFGAWLRTQREARGISMQAIAETSKISLRYLEALERDRFDVLPAPVFVRGFLREYARVVGLDADEVVNYHLLSQPAPVQERASESRASSGRGERNLPRRAPLVGYIVLVTVLLGVFVGIAAGISWWAGRRGAGAAPAAAPVGAAEQVREVALAPPPEVVDRQPVPVDALAPPAERPLAPAELPAAGRLRVVLEFQQDCWVEVVVDGRRRESELKAGGETLALEADDYVSLTLGNAPAVRVEVNGQPFPVSTLDSRVVRGLRIDRAALTPPGPVAGESPGR